MRILIIHNDKSLAHAINRELDETLYKIRFAGDGDVGLEIALEMQFNLIVLNWLLPKKDGMSLLIKLREQKISTPILMLVADESMRDAILALDLEVDINVEKALDIREFVTKMKSLMHMRMLNPCFNYNALGGEMVET
jgi:DNA-binding response OmpR family regulator